jgi:F-type H+-transporting ATPase subunit delta
MKAVRLYAQVLVDVLSSPDTKFSMEMTLKELDGFSKLLTESPLMAKVFDNPVLAESEKQKALGAFVQKLNLSQMSEKFLNMLIKRNRIGILPQVLTEVESIQVQKNGGLMGELISAIPLDGTTISSITQAISKKMNKTVRLKEKVDPSLIAGLRVTVGGKTFDSSVRTKLNKVKDSFQ